MYKIKGLVWVEEKVGLIGWKKYIGKSLSGVVIYEVLKTDTREGWSCETLTIISDTLERYGSDTDFDYVDFECKVDTLDEAKQACQSHFETLMKQGLEEV